MEWQTLDGLIEELDAMSDFVSGRGVRGTLGILVPSAHSWADVWAKAADIQKGFEDVRYPTVGQREQAWQRFNSLRDNAAKLSKEDREARRWTSESLRNEILSKIESARPNNLFGFDPVRIEDMKALGRVLRDAGELLSEHKNEMLGEHKQECFHAIQKMRTVHDAWWAELKQEKGRRHADFQARVRSNLQKNYERHRKATEALARHRARADELRSQIASAWNENWAAKAEDWLSELEDKIADIERSIEQVEDWISEDERKLSS